LAYFIGFVQTFSLGRDSHTA